MKKVFKNPIFMFILGGIVFGTIGVIASNTILASNISYGNGTVETAINDLYTKAKPDYTGTVIYTPSNTTQTIPTENTILRSNIVINQIPSTYKELSSLTHELTASDLLSGKQAYKADGTVVNGNISTFTPSSSYTPTTSGQTLSTSGKYVNGNITIGAIPSTYKELSGTANISADKILSGYSAYDNNGELVVGTHTETSTLTPVLLWTNSNPKTAFAAQTISLNLSQYKYVIVSTLTSTSDVYAPYVHSIVPVLSSSKWNVESNISATGSGFVRTISATSTGVKLGIARKASENNNNILIPYKIYGIKDNLKMDFGIN